MDPKRLEAIAQMVGAVADDFQSLLATILDHAARLDEDLDPADPRARSVAGIRHAAQLGTSLTDQLLIFGRKHTPQVSVLDLNVSVDATRRLLQRVAGRQVTVQTVTAPDLRPVRANTMQIDQMLVNLAANARDAMPDGGTLTIETANVTIDAATAQARGVAAGDYVTVAVIDSGVGIDDSIRPHLFEPFFTTKRREGATGLGLATVYGIVTQAGGHLLVDSEVGRGARFTVFLPAMADDAPRTASGSATETATATIVLAEEDPNVRALVSTVLKRRGYHVLLAEEACDAHVDLWIGDEPAGDGKRLRLSKPFTPDALAREVRAALER